MKLRKFDTALIVIALAEVVGICILSRRVMMDEERFDGTVQYRDIKIKGHDYIDVVSRVGNGFVHAPVHSPECKKCYLIYD